VEQGRLIAGRYRLDEKIATGGMGIVWRATDTELDRTVALEQAKDPAAPADQHDLRREARYAARLSHHEHVVPMYDSHWRGSLASRS
jgi:eukaryotic-like serine/threonine-protein kinase